jgi:hypothetical protein
MNRKEYKNLAVIVKFSISGYQDVPLSNRTCRISLRCSWIQF